MAREVKQGGCMLVGRILPPANVSCKYSYNVQVSVIYNLVVITALG